MIDAIKVNLIDHFLVGGKEFTLFVERAGAPRYGLVARTMGLEAC